MFEDYCSNVSRPMFFDEYPHNLVYSLARNMSWNCPSKPSRDMLAGMQYAFSTLTKDEQEILWLRYKYEMTVEETASCLSITENEVCKLEKKAIRTLQLPGRWSYIQHGVVGAMRKRIGEEYRIAYHKGYCDGYEAGTDDVRNGLSEMDTYDQILELPIETMELSKRALSCLQRAQLHRIRDIAGLSERDILAMRNLGKKLADEVAKTLRKFNIKHTAWDKFLL